MFPFQLFPWVGMGLQRISQKGCECKFESILLIMEDRNRKKQYKNDTVRTFEVTVD